MQVLVLCNDYWHPARVPRAGLDPLSADSGHNAGFKFDWIERAGDWSAEKMAGYPVVLLTRSNNTSSTDQAPWMSDVVQQAFADYVRAGGGLVVIHSGSAGYAETPVLRRLMGGVFVEHPPQCDVTYAPQAGHPLTGGSAPFTVKDEHYRMAFDDAQAEVFMTGISERGAQPAGWTRAEGKGRVCMLTPGHNVEVWLRPAYQTIIRNALRWCGRSAESLSRAQEILN